MTRVQFYPERPAVTFQALELCFCLQLCWQVFRALLTVFLLSCTRLAFNRYWDSSPLHVVQWWHLEILLRKFLTIWASSRLSTCIAIFPRPLPAASHHSPQLSSPSSLPQLSAASLIAARLVDPGQPIFPTCKCDGRFFCLQLMFGFHPLPWSEECSCSMCRGTDLPGHLPGLQKIVTSYLIFLILSFKPSVSSAELWEGLLTGASSPSQPQCRFTGSVPKALTFSVTITSAVCLSAVSNLLNRPLPLLHPLWVQEQASVIRRRFAWQIHSQAAAKTTGWSLHTAAGRAGSTPQCISTHTGACMYISCKYVQSFTDIYS